MTRTPTLMECGHTANATNAAGDPVCVIDIGTIGAVTPARTVPDLAERTARCYCGTERPSSIALAFFEYRGEGSSFAADHCHSCGMFQTVHQEVNPHTGRAGVTAHPFVPRGPHMFDSFYDGCHGWD